MTAAPNFSIPVLRLPQRTSERLKMNEKTQKNYGRKGAHLLIRHAPVLLLFLLPCVPAARGQIQTLTPNDPLLEQARTFLRQGRLEEADHAVRQDLAARPDSADAHFLLGFILFREIQSGASLEHGSGGARYNALDPTLTNLASQSAKASLAEYTAGAHYRNPGAADLKIVALDYVILGDFVDADKWLTRSLQWNPQDADGWYYLGRTKYSENRFEEAIHAFQRCLNVEPRNVKAQDNLGLSLEGLGEVDEAIAAYETAITWEQEGGVNSASSGGPNAGPYLDLGSLLLDQNRPQDALPHLQRAAEIAPREARAREKLGKAYSDLNRLPDAQRELEEAVKLSPQSARLHFMLGQVYRKQGMTEKAKAEMQLSGALDGTRSTP